MKVAKAVAVLALALAGGCSGDEGPKKGQIMLALQTDMSIPDDVTHVRIVIFKNGALKFDQKYRVGPQGEEIPATLGVIASDNASDTTEVRVLSYRAATVRTLNRVVTTIPQDRIATLRVPIQWLCDNQVVPTEGVADSYDSACESPDESCVAGECRKVDVDSTALPDFHIEDITGGAKQATKGVCFDVAPCLDPGRDVVPDAACTIGVPSAELDRLNVGLRLPRGRGGICSPEGGCYIPLDRDDESGWRVSSGSGNTTRVALPSAVCKKLASGDAAAVRVSMACDTKTPVHPTCGPWTSVGKENPNIGPRPDLTPGSGAGGDSGSGIDTGGEPSATGGKPTGTGGATGNAGGFSVGPEECPDFAEDAAVIAPDPEVDRVARLSLEIGRRTARLRSDIAQACAAIDKRITGTQTSVGAEPTDEELEAACAAAKQAVPDDGGSWRASVGAGYCRADVNEQLTLEAMCPSVADCAFGELQERCSSLLTECDGACSGSCLPGEGSLDVSCEGACLGQCVGTCSGECRGPGGNQLPSTDCMGECSGTCSGRCQGQCTSFETCEGMCRGSCDGTVTGQYCEDALAVPACATTAACPSLAAATAGLHRGCMPPTVFVVGQTPPEVAPAIADNLPALIHALTEAHGVLRASVHLERAWSALATSFVEGINRACLGASAMQLSTVLPSLTQAIAEADAVVHELLGSGTPVPEPMCSVDMSDNTCNACMKVNCCAEMTECAQSLNCTVETQCLRDCRNQGNAPAICETRCRTEGAFDPATEAYRTCETESCGACNSVAIACFTATAAGVLIDDFDDGDTVSPFGPWRVTGSEGFLGSLSSITPGAFGSPHALGVAGRPDPGLSIDFTQCVDARASSELAFDAVIPDSTVTTPVTIRVRTSETETPDRGGACVASRCGDHHVFTASISGGSFTPIAVPWGNLQDSFARPPDLTTILGLDFVVYGTSSSGQLVIDNLRLGAQQEPIGAQEQL